MSAPSQPQVADEKLPPRPEMGDCCGGGCAVCVLEGYDEEVRRWELRVEEILKKRAQNLPPA